MRTSRALKPCMRRRTLLITLCSVMLLLSGAFGFSGNLGRNASDDRPGRTALTHPPTPADGPPARRRTPSSTGDLST